MLGSLPLAILSLPHSKIPSRAPESKVNRSSNILHHTLLHHETSHRSQVSCIKYVYKLQVLGTNSKCIEIGKRRPTPECRTIVPIDMLFHILDYVGNLIKLNSTATNWEGLHRRAKYQGICVSFLTLLFLFLLSFLSETR